RSRRKVAMTIDWPWAEMERSSSIPSTVLTASSMTWETSVSTSSGEAPGRVVRTLTVGRSTEGRRSTPRRGYEAAPTTTSARISIAARPGRWMQSAASRRMRPAGGVRYGGRVGAGAEGESNERRGRAGALGCGGRRGDLHAGDALGEDAGGAEGGE